MSRGWGGGVLYTVRPIMDVANQPTHTIRHLVVMFVRDLIVTIVYLSLQNICSGDGIL